MGNDDADALKHKVALACNILAKEGLTDFLGHVSCKTVDDDSILVSPTSKNLANVRDEDILRISLKGKLSESNGKPPSELPIHTSIYKSRPDVGAVIHAHPKFATLFSITGERVVPVCHLGAPFIDGVPLFEEYGLVDNVISADKLARNLGNKRAILLKNHGAVVVGRTIEEACILTIWLEKNCELLFMSKVTGRINAIPLENSSRSLVAHYLNRTVGTAWDHYASKIVGD